MADEPLNEQDLKAAVGELSGWELREGSIRRDFKFGDFSSAFGFMSAVAIVAAEMNHHPDWSNVYSSVSMTLSTHEAGGVTQLDLDLASRASTVAEAFGAQ